MDSLLHSVFTPLWPVLLLLAVIVFLLLLVRQASPRHYQKRRFLLTKSELHFYRSLRLACDSDYTICSKVRIADLLSPPSMSNKKAWWKMFTKISSKHIDFVLCDPSNMSIECCIELDDRSHRKVKRRERDAFVNKAFAGAELPLLRLPTRSAYDPDTIRQKISVAVDV